MRLFRQFLIPNHKKRQRTQTKDTRKGTSVDEAVNVLFCLLGGVYHNLHPCENVWQLESLATIGKISYVYVYCRAFESQCW
jgi:hypothetical protein